VSSLVLKPTIVLSNVVMSRESRAGEVGAKPGLGTGLKIVLWTTPDQGVAWP